MWWNNGMEWGAMGGGGWVVMMVLMLAFWALVVAGVVALFRTGRPAVSNVSNGVSDAAATPGPSAEDVLGSRSTAACMGSWSSTIPTIPAATTRNGSSSSTTGSTAPAPPRTRS